MASTIPTFIITSHTEDGFIKFIYDSSQFIHLSNPIILPDVQVFKIIYNLFEVGANYRLLIHPAINKNDDIVIGERILNSLKELGIQDIPFITRALQIREKCKESNVNFIRKKDGYTYYDATRVELDNFVEDIPIFVKNRPIFNEDEIKVEPPNSDKIDFAILTALSEDENSAFRLKLSENPGDLFEASNYIKGKFAEIHSVKNDFLKDFILYRQPQMGMVDASICTNKIIYEFNPKFIIMAGVCGGRIGKINRYDIIIPRQIIEFTTGKLENGEIQTYSYNSKTMIDLHTWLSEPNRKEEIKSKMFSLIPTTDKKFKNICGSIDIKFDDIACVPWVIKTDDWLNINAKKFDEKIIGLEMESYGVNRSYDLNNHKLFASLVVKSVMDFTDSKKSDSDLISKENYKETASYMSYLCIRALMPLLMQFHEMQKNAH